jgi:hypothetical protein
MLTFQSIDLKTNYYLSFYIFGQQILLGHLLSTVLFNQLIQVIILKQSRIERLLPYQH